MPGEIFVTMSKEGSTISGLMGAFATMVSFSLQYGVPLEVLVNKFSHTRFEPMGYTTNPDIRIAKSLVDYIFRWLGLTFIPGYREATLGLPASGSKPEIGAVPAAPPAEKLTLEVQPANGHSPEKTSRAANGRNGNADLLDRAGARMRDPVGTGATKRSRLKP